MLGDDLDAIQRASGIRLSNTAPRSKLKINLLSAATNSAVSPRIGSGRRASVCLSWNALLVGIDQRTGDIADRPAMPIDEFQRLITFGTVTWLAPANTSFEGLEYANLRGDGQTNASERANEVGTDEV